VAGICHWGLGPLKADGTLIFSSCLAARIPRKNLLLANPPPLYNRDETPRIPMPASQKVAWRKTIR
jgi:hypothetical protein